MMRTVTIPFRKITSALPAVALISGGIVLSASAGPADLHLGVVASRGPAIVVPDVAMTQPSLTQTDTFHTAEAAAPNALAPNAVAVVAVVARAGESAPQAALAVSADTSAATSPPVTADSQGIPGRALAGYRQAALVTSSADPSCHIDWALLAGIGKVESNHARFGGNRLDANGVAQPGIIGIPLDGSNGTARITDTDQGRLDRDTVFDRAVGPMQFIPGTWRFAGVDANGDGVKNPENMADAAAATAVYLCSGPGDLRRPADLRSAILRYNNSDAYARLVTSIAASYRPGVRVLPDLATTGRAFSAAPAVSRVTTTSSTGSPASRQPASNQAGSNQAGAQPRALTPRASTATSRTSAPSAPSAASPKKSPATSTKTGPSPAKPTAPRATTPAPHKATPTTAPKRPTTPNPTTQPKPRVPAKTPTTTPAPAPRTTPPPTSTPPCRKNNDGDKSGDHGKEWDGKGGNRDVAVSTRDSSRCDR